MNLLPCPFCGSKDVSDSFSFDIDNNPFSVFIECIDCSAMGPVLDLKKFTKEDAGVLWNVRFLLPIP